jgi:hypothetical protein
MYMVFEFREAKLAHCVAPFECHQGGPVLGSQNILTKNGAYIISLFNMISG